MSACSDCISARVRFGRAFLCLPCFDAQFALGDHRRTPQYRQAYDAPLSRRELVQARTDLAVAGIPMWPEEGAPISGEVFDPWDSVVDALDAGGDPVRAQFAEYADTTERSSRKSGEVRALSERARNQRRDRAAYMREYRARKKAA